MYIHNRSVAALYKLFIGALAVGLVWYLFGKFSWGAVRLFPTWVLFVSAVYYILSSLITALNKKSTGKNPAPMFEGMIIMGFILMIGMAIASCQHHFYLPELSNIIMILACVLMPVLTFLDWVLFVKKGRWRVMAPFYWLALPVCYAAAMIFSAHFMLDSEPLHYPLEIFNYFDIGVLEMLGWIMVVVILDLAVGYILFLLDFAMGGKLAQKVVLPHVQVIEIDENGREVRQSVEGAKTQKVDNKTKVQAVNEPKVVNPSKVKNTQKDSATAPKPEKVQNTTKTQSAESIKVNIKTSRTGIKQKKTSTQKEQIKRMQDQVGSTNKKRKK